MIDLQELLPKNISDETAFHLTQFVTNLALEIQAYYFEQIMRSGSEKNSNESDFIREK